MARAFLVAACILVGSWVIEASADEVAAGSLKISMAWVRATPKAAPVGGGYLTIANTGSTSDRLVGGSSEVCTSVEIHEMEMANGVMKMRPVSKGLEIKPGDAVVLKPGGYHLMFVGLKKPFEEGQHVKATLKFEKAGSVPVDFLVEGLGARTGGVSSGATQMHRGN